MRSLMWALFVLVVIAGVVLLWPSRPLPPPTPPPQALRHPVPPPPAAVAPGPVPSPANDQERSALGLDRPLPALDASDERLTELLGQLWPGEQLGQFFLLDHFVQRLVLLVDSLPRDRLPASRLPTRPVSGSFLAAARDQELVIAPANSRRYTPWVTLAEAIDPQRAVAVYRYLYPLFQQAYRDLGYPRGQFNDRLLAVIDHLLETPELVGPVRLVRPKILYRFADPDLEARSAGQKILLRCGPQNAARLKAVLRNLRRALLAAPPAG